MRIENRYIRNKVFRNKYWNKIRRKEHPYQTLCPMLEYRERFGNDIEEQIKWHFDSITEQSRAIENGAHSGRFSSPSCFRRMLNQERRAKERVALRRIRNGDYDVEVPRFRKDADWYYF